VHLDSLADMMTVVFEGAFILSRTLKEPQAFAEQLRHYRQYLELLFA
jgi:TetR/AcrR family transcriptional repressor of nem operon